MNVKLYDSDIIVVRDIEYLLKLMDLIESTPSRIIGTFLLFIFEQVCEYICVGQIIVWGETENENDAAEGMYSEDDQFCLPSYAPRRSTRSIGISQIKILE